MFIKISNSDFQQYYNNLKPIWINTKKEDRVLIKTNPGDTNKND